jgi:malonyl-CoA O-methyltransferase
MFHHAPSPAADPYREWAPFYPPEAHNVLMHVEEAAVLSLLPDVAQRRVLDAGSGTGRYARLVVERGAAQVVCVDRSPAMLRHAKATARRIQADLAALPIADASFDVVVSGLAVMDVRDLSPVLCEWARVLGPRGVVICSTLHPRGESLGWTRTFDTPAGSGRLPSCWHSLDDFRRACVPARLSIDAVASPGVDGSGDAPVALIVRAHRID